MTVKLEKLTPIECLEQGYPMTEARQMDPEDLTRENCIKLLEGGFEQYVIRFHYNFSAEDWLAKMKEWGLNRASKNWDFKKSDGKAAGEPGAAEPGAADPNKAEVARTAATLTQAPEVETKPEPPVPQLAPETSLAPTDLTRKAAAELLAGGTTKQQLKRLYNFKNDASLYLKLQNWGLHERRHTSDCKTDPEEVIRVAKSVLRWIEEQEENPKGAGNEQSKVALVGGRAVVLPEAVSQQPQGNIAMTFKDNDDLFEIQSISDSDLKDLVGVQAPMPEPGPESELTGDGQGTAEPPGSLAVTQAVEAGEIKVATVEHSAPHPSDPFADLGFEECEPKLQRAGELWIRVSLKGDGHAGGSIAFSCTAWKSFTGHSFTVEVSRRGDVVRLTEDPNGKFKARGDARHVAAGNTVVKLRERWVALPARYRLEWRGDIGAWIGTLIERSGESEATA